MDYASAIVINNEVRSNGSFSPAERGQMVDYYAREGTYREGNVREATDDDRLLQAKYVASIRDMVEYGAREGRFEGRNPEIPLQEGQQSGGFFGPHGVVQSQRVLEEVVLTNSHIVRSVVAVRREDAAKLGLETKQDFERLLRATWAENVAKWKVMSPEDIRWYAAFHTDNERNVHVHVITYDASSRFGRLAPVIPKENMVEGQRIVREKALEREISGLTAERDYLREIARVRAGQLAGAQVPEKTMERLEALREASGSSLTLDAMRDPEAQEIRRASECAGRIREAMPEGDDRILSAARSSDKVIEALMRELDAAKRDDPVLAAAYAGWRRAVRDGYRAAGAVGAAEYGDRMMKAEDAKLLAAEHDLNRRCMNSMLRALRNGPERDAGDMRHRDILVQERGPGREAGAERRQGQPERAEVERGREALGEIELDAAAVGDAIASAMMAFPPDRGRDEADAVSIGRAAGRREGPDESRTEHREHGR